MTIFVALAGLLMTFGLPIVFVARWNWQGVVLGALVVWLLPFGIMEGLGLLDPESRPLLDYAIWALIGIPIGLVYGSAVRLYKEGVIAAIRRMATQKELDSNTDY